jgi:deazaflavin-dependent oxidoreductase (nitroreductase family)
MDGLLAVLPVSALPGALSEPPHLSGVARVVSDASRVMFRLANRWVMVPLHRAGLGAWLGSPLVGWQCLLTTTGRRSGLPRPVPLGYIVMDGAAWVLAGYGPRTAWLRNIGCSRSVELRLPGRAPRPAIAQEVPDPDVRARVMPALCRSMALPGSAIGTFPPTASDERILERVSWVPLVRLTAAGGEPIVAGPDDPGGHAWIWRQALASALAVALLTALRAVVRGRRRSMLPCVAAGESSVP